MDLLIVRHATAFERNPKRWPDDSDRPLSPEGIERARKAATGLKRVLDRPPRLLTSPLARARQTAAILTEFAGWPKAVDCPALVPDESPEALLEVLRATPQKVVAVVGHQPHLGHLIAACLPGAVKPEAFDLKKFGVVHLSFPGPPRAGHAVLNGFIPPKLLRALR
jgi:phosphohistidine phosphatase